MLKRITSLRWFFWVPTTFGFRNKRKIIWIFSYLSVTTFVSGTKNDHLFECPHKIIDKVKLWIFSYLSVLTFVLGTQKNNLTETILFSTHNIWFAWETRKLILHYHTLLPIGLATHEVCQSLHIFDFSKILNTNCLPQRPKPTVQTQIRLLMKKQSVQGLHSLLFWRAFCYFHP